MGERHLCHRTLQNQPPTAHCMKTTSDPSLEGRWGPRRCKRIELRVTFFAFQQRC